MTKKKFFASLGVMTALVGTTVFGAMLCMGNAASFQAPNYRNDAIKPVLMCACGNGALEEMRMEPTTYRDGYVSHYCDSCLYYSKTVLPMLGSDEVDGEAEVVSSGIVSLKVDLGGLDDKPTMSVQCPECETGMCSYMSRSATCTLGGYYSYGACSRYPQSCTFSGESGNTPAKGHNVSGVVGTTVEGTSTYCEDTVRECKNCGLEIYEESGTTSRTRHTDSIIDEKPATCSEEGYAQHQCTRCEYSWTETLPVSDSHVRDEGTITKYPTCITEGLKTYACQYCGEPMGTEVIPMSAHKYTENGDGTLAEVTDEDGVITRQPTCLTDGQKTYYCLVCNGAPQTVVLEHLGHKWVKVSAVEATCTEPGQTGGTKCENCDEWQAGNESVEIPALGHDWPDEWEESREDCTEVGTRTRTCRRCQEVETEELAAGQHSWNTGTVTKQPTCTENGMKSCECVYCGAQEEQTIPALGHTAVKVAAVAPTCTQTGLTEGSKCSRCDIVLEVQQLVPAKGHNLMRIPGVEPTVVSEGNIEYWHCSSCGSFFADKNGKTEISADDTILDRLPAEGVDGDGDALGEEDGGMSGWQIALAVVAGVVLLAGIGLALDKFVFNKDGNSIYDRAVNKVKSKGKK